MNKTINGFTLIELMIVIAVIGILTALSLPAYNVYSGRTQVAEALSLSGALRTAATEFRALNGAFPTAHNQMGMALSGAIQGQYVASVAIDSTGNGVITATMKNQNVANGLANATLLLSPITRAGAIEWRCKAGTMDATFLPSACR